MFDCVKLLLLKNATTFLSLKGSAYLISLQSKHTEAQSNEHPLLLAAFEKSLTSLFRQFFHTAVLPCDLKS